MTSRCVRSGLILLGFLALPSAYAAGSWAIEDDSSTIGFVALQQGAPIEGGFESFEADIDFDPADLATSRINVTIDMSSVATGHKDRDATLQSSAFFDVEQWPTARFVSRDVRQAGDGYEARGTLTMRDVTKEVVLPFALELEGDEAHATGELEVLRLDYGIGQGSWTATTTVADEVVIKIDIEAARTG